MADDVNRASRKDFLSSFDDVEKFLEASESAADDDEVPKTTDIEITTDLGSSTSMLSPTSPMPYFNRSLEGKLHPQDPIAEEISETESSQSPEKDLHSDTPLPHADTPLPNPSDYPVSSNTGTESSDEITVHQESDSLNTEALKLMAGMKSSRLSSENVIQSSEDVNRGETMAFEPSSIVHPAVEAAPV